MTGVKVVDIKTGEGASLEGRVASLEGRMTAVEAGVLTASQAAAEAAENTRELLQLAKAAKTFGGFLRGHWRTALGFGVGLLAAAGYDSPALSFVRHFFGL